MSQEVVSYYEDFKEIEKKIWGLLTNAVTDRSSEFRTPVFICGNDNDLDGRVVVLRKADQQNSFVQYHSDIRSSKIKKIKQNPNCSMLFYGKQEKIQLRVKAECKVHFDNEVTKKSWEKTGHISRKCYLVTNGPGTESETPTSGLDSKFDNFNFTQEESEAGYKNFCVIGCKVKSIEWLYLAAKGHRRALIDLENNKKNWLVP
ncbi:pyridoxamine 5'-phosphate oxidase family protein [Pelagibacteraceae bacterium]|nr:pyridoxamine 5'-phosphate oxidase family protein [Pelagibacteraceae bacterium]